MRHEGITETQILERFRNAVGVDATQEKQEEERFKNANNTTSSHYIPFSLIGGITRYLAALKADVCNASS